MIGIFNEITLNAIIKIFGFRSSTYIICFPISPFCCCFSVHPFSLSKCFLVQHLNSTIEFLATFPLIVILAWSRNYNMLGYMIPIYLKLILNFFWLKQKQMILGTVNFQLPPSILCTISPYITPYKQINQQVNTYITYHSYLYNSIAYNTYL